MTKINTLKFPTLVPILDLLSLLKIHLLHILLTISLINVSKGANSVDPDQGLHCLSTQLKHFSK